MKNIFFSIISALLIFCYPQNVVAQNNNIPLNKIIISKINLPNDNNTYTVLELSDNHNYLQYKYNNLEVSVIYYSKHYEFNPETDDYYNVVNIRYMIEIEKYNSGEINEVPKITFTQNNRLNIINGIKYFDTFIFAAHDYMDLRRVLFFTTENYYIRIIINIPERELGKIFENIYKEVPEYFLIKKNESMIGFRFHEYTQWNYEENSKIKFGGDLLNGQNKSIIANNWLNATEEILNKISIE